MGFNTSINCPIDINLKKFLGFTYKITNFKLYKRKSKLYLIGFGKTGFN